MANQSGALDGVFRALADPTRRRIVRRLGRGPATVSQLATLRPIALPTLLEHLRVLERGRVIRTRKVGRVRHCELRPRTLGRAVGWLQTERRRWTIRLDQLDALLLSLKDSDR
jgi:DNA-binding transcriptional ArsR family regulator